MASLAQFHGFSGRTIWCSTRLTDNRPLINHLIQAAVPNEVPVFRSSHAYGDLAAGLNLDLAGQRCAGNSGAIRYVSQVPHCRPNPEREGL